MNQKYYIEKFNELNEQKSKVEDYISDLEKEYLEKFAKFKINDLVTDINSNNRILIVKGRDFDVDNITDNRCGISYRMNIIHKTKRIDTDLKHNSGYPTYEENLIPFVESK